VPSCCAGYREIHTKVSAIPLGNCLASVRLLSLYYPTTRKHTAEGQTSAIMKILQVLTSHDQLGNTGRKTGFWLEEGAAPYFVFRDAGADLTLASPKGGQPPIDPKSDLPENQTPAMARFKKDERAQKAFANTVKLADVKAEDFDTVFYSGGHGPMWDLAESPVSIALLESFYSSGKPIALGLECFAMLNTRVLRL
jgi:hypothetical protein